MNIEAFGLISFKRELALRGKVQVASVELSIRQA